jgi:hypothetical protein
MSCCHHCRDAESLFDRRDAARRLARYQRKGPEGTTRLLIEGLRAAKVEGATLLDIGGGVGVVHHELLRAGAASAIDIDASSAYIEAARAESARRGTAARVAYQHGNFVAIADTIAPTDIVVLDRVVCCYPDMPALVGAAAARAGRLLGLVYPRDAWWVRLGVRAGNLAFALQRTSFRIFCHPTAAVDAQIRRAGLAPLLHKVAGPWQVAIYQRS